MEHYSKKEIVIIIQQLSKLFLYIILIFSLARAKESFDLASSISYTRQRLAFSYINHAFFCPEDNLKMLIIGLINLEKTAIYAALYQITDPDIAQALINAKKRGVHIEIIVDSSALTAKNSQVNLLKQHHITIYYYRKGFYSIMHNKFFIFANVFGRSLVWTGSANATTGGTKRNQENVVITQCPTIISRYRYKFQDLKTISSHKNVCKQEDMNENCASLLQFLLSWFPGY